MILRWYHDDLMMILWCFFDDLMMMMIRWEEGLWNWLTMIPMMMMVVVMMKINMLIFAKMMIMIMMTMMMMIRWEDGLWSWLMTQPLQASPASINQYLSFSIVIIIFNQIIILNHIHHIHLLQSTGIHLTLKLHNSPNRLRIVITHLYLYNIQCISPYIHTF